MKKKSKTISVSDAIDQYYKRNKSKLDALYGSERAAKSQLKNMPDIPATRFNDPKHATRAFNEFISSEMDPAGYELKIAKKDAMSNTPGHFQKIQQLNKRIDKNGFNPFNKSLGTVNGQNVSIEGYYEIKNSNMVLAKMRYESGINTQIFQWEFVDKAVL